MKQYIIDRLEGDFAVCETEDKKIVSLTNDLLPAGAKEGDLLIEEQGVLYLDLASTEKKRRSMLERLNNMFEESEETDEKKE